MEAYVAKLNDKNKGTIFYLRLTQWSYLLEISQALTYAYLR